GRPAAYVSAASRPPRRRVRRRDTCGHGCIVAPTPRRMLGLYPVSLPTVGDRRSLGNRRDGGRTRRSIRADHAAATGRSASAGRAGRSVRVERQRTAVAARAPGTPETPETAGSAGSTRASVRGNLRGTGRG